MSIGNVRECSRRRKMKPLAVDVRTAATMTGLSSHTIRQYIRHGLLRVTRCGRRILIPAGALEKLVETGVNSHKPVEELGGRYDTSRETFQRFVNRSRNCCDATPTTKHYPCLGLSATHTVRKTWASRANPTL
jgi:excisionase family DNA binding protein